ncbi:transposon Ty3-G Gag-Pol polyprotein [Elysia marginata]|uniref:Transposon Ty3-G Gag-Pol polyprotein n=1 Tax=Elysia marginata TaxID=1093978 RepID=A0AAV4EFR7_9GAST|nr:transposon Ty3-G Gag-Pol polyprotein [Elysia marginata]
MEQSIRQVQKMSSSKTSIDTVQSGRKFVRKKFPQGGLHRKAPTPANSNCTRCGKVHSPKNCAAKDAVCYICNKIGHFAKLFRSKKQAKVNLNELDSEELETFLGTVSSRIDNPWKTKVLVDGKEIVFKIDTGVDVTVIPESAIPPGIQLSCTSRKFFGPGQTKVDLPGKFTALLQLNSAKTSTQEIYVLKVQKEALLGRPAIQSLNIIQRMNTITEPDEGKGGCQQNTTLTEENIKEKFPQLFTGLGKFDKNYTIELKEEAKPFSVSTPIAA